MNFTQYRGERAGFTNSKREWLFGIDSISFGSNGWQPGNLFDQPELESPLRAMALQHPNVTSYIGAEVKQCSSEADSVSVSAVSNAEAINIKATYMIACDGAASLSCAIS